MKTILLLLFALPIFTNAQLTTNSIQHNGGTRDYKQYVPASYDGNTSVPIVLCLHGLGDNMTNFSGIGMNFVADTANFIVLTPQALLETQFTNSTAWNSGASYLGFTLNPSVNDVNFLKSLIDSTILNYNIDVKRIYVCGFSMGGFMANRLACELGYKFAAIASVAGTIGGAINCTPGREMPVLHIHGTNDATIDYYTGAYGMNATDLVNHWTTNNGCNPIPDSTDLPDIANDGYTVTHFTYPGCTNNMDVEHMRVNGADHVWLGPSNDIFYTTEIWKFFLKHENPSEANISEVNNDIEVTIFPNPALLTSTLSFQSNQNEKIVINISNLNGKLIQQNNFNISNGINNIELDVSSLKPGVYLINFNTNNKVITKKITIN